MDTTYGSRVIRRIRNWSNVLSCEVQTLIHRISFAGYDFEFNGHALPENESFHFDVPSSPRPPAKPPDDGIYFEPDTGVLTVKVVGDIFELYVHVPNGLTTLPTLSPMFDTLLPFSSKNDENVFKHGILVSNEEKSPHLLSRRGFKAFQAQDLVNKNKIALDFEASRARGFVLRSLEPQSFA
ncbi:hypothetical protein Tco_0926901 [Tanacetum coccineum]|uniref:Uncharacterized protein n=1 Tax=Tanacetum coccineum TaxID=301880 RepID=A0ABQ5DDS1_9ASTR